VDTSREEARPALAFSLVVGGRSSNVSFRSHGSRQFHSMFGQLILEIEYAETEQGSARLSYATERFPTRLDVLSIQNIADDSFHGWSDLECFSHRFST
jgi:hypothetical protein